MRKKGVTKEETRQRILEAAGAEFRANGYTGIGVDGLAKAAGATSGAFYAHFGSKEAAFAQALESGLDEVLQTIPQYQIKHGPHWVKAFAEYYLGTAHRNNISGGCAMAALTSEVVRSSNDIKKSYEKKLDQITALLAMGLKGDDDSECRARAWAMLSILIGGINISRAMKSKQTANEVASATITAAIAAAGLTIALEQN